VLCHFASRRVHHGISLYQRRKLNELSGVFEARVGIG
jgi:hypothetical protein